MARGGALHARKLAAQADEAEAVLDRALEQARNLGDRQRRGVVAGAARSATSAAPSSASESVDGRLGHEHPAAGLGRARTCAGVEAGAIAAAATGCTPRRAIPASREHAELVALDAADHGAVVAFCARAAHRPGRDRARSAAGRWARRFACAPPACAVFGPSRAAAQLEGSRASPRSCAPRAGIPTAAYVRATALAAARAALDDFALPVVIKADGLAAGKGVIIAETRERGRGRAGRHVRRAASARPGAEVVIEEFLEGEEASFFALTDGATIVAVRLGAGPQARRRGRYRPQHRRHGRLQPGAGAHPELEGEAIERIVAPTVRAMADDGHALFGRALCRADADPRGAQADRVQLPLRRSRMPGADDAAARATSANCCSPAPRTGSPRSSRRASRRRYRADRGDGGARAIPARRQKGGRDRRRSERRRRAGRKVFHAGTALAPTAGWWPAAAACSTSPRAASRASREAQRRRWLYARGRRAIDFAARLLPPRHRLARESRANAGRSAAPTPSIRLTAWRRNFTR